MSKPTIILHCMHLALLLSLLPNIGCRSVRPTNQVVVVQPRKPTRIWATPWDYVFGDAIKQRFGSNLYQIRNEEVLAWAVKAYPTELPTRLTQESIGVVSWIDQTNHPHFTLAIFVLDAGNEAWKLYPAQGEKVLEDLTAPPSAQRTADFVRSTNFGHNDFNPRSNVEVWRVESYSSSPAFIKALHGISEKERRRRYGLKFEQF